MSSLSYKTRSTALCTYGIKYVTRAEISAFNHQNDGSATPGPYEKVSYWPGHRSNRSLASQLCEDVRCETCEVKCGFGKEYLKRVEMGKMTPIAKGVAV